MDKKICACGCGREVLDPRPSSKYAGRECFYKSLKGHRPYNPKRRVMLVCRGCGIEFEAGGRSGKKRSSLFHDQECMGNAKRKYGLECLPLSETQAAYIAGFMDGEGSVILYNRGPGREAVAMRILFTNTHFDVLKWLQRTMGVGSIVHSQGNLKHKDAGIMQVNSQSAASVLKQIEPYLIIKREQAKLALEFQAAIAPDGGRKKDKAWREECRLRMCAMNQRGPKAAAL